MGQAQSIRAERALDLDLSSANRDVSDTTIPSPDQYRKTETSSPMESETHWKSRITKVDLSNKKLTELPYHLSVFENLEILNLSDNEIVTLNEDVTKYMKCIRRLNCSNNYISKLEGLEKMKSVEFLDLTQNPIHLQSLNETLPRLTSLIGLGLSSCHLQEFPLGISKLRHIKKLAMFRNKLFTLPAQIGLLVNLVKLDLSSNSLQEIPDEICFLKQLVWLNLSNNCITQLPQGLGNLHKLVELGLGGNLLHSVPDLTKLKNLTLLSLHRNQLRFVSDSMLALRLEKIDLACNKIENIPEKMFHLPCLKYLNLRANRISFLPELNIAALAPLQILNLNDNQLMYIPFSYNQIITLKCLKSLGNPMPKHLAGQKDLVLPLADMCLTRLIESKTESPLPKHLQSRLAHVSSCVLCHTQFVSPGYGEIFRHEFPITAELNVRKGYCSRKCLSNCQKSPTDHGRFKNLVIMISAYVSSWIRTNS